MRNASRHPCKFCARADDSIEHLAQCDVIRNSFTELGLTCSNLDEFFALDKPSFPASFLKKVKLLSAIYLTHSSLTHSSSPFDSLRLLRCTVSSALPC